jgi:hypothetical protein
MVNFIQKGGKIKSIYRIGLDFKIQKGDKITESKPGDLIEVLNKFASAGEQIKLTSRDIPNMTIIDNKDAFINVNDKWVQRHSQVDIIFRQSNFTHYLKDLFEFYWKDSITIEDYKTLHKNITVT